MRHVLAAIEAPVFFRGPIARTAPCPKIGLGAVRQEYAPSILEIGARLAERSRGAALMFLWMRSRIEPTAPAPLIGIGRIARAERDRAYSHISVVDQPGLLQGVGVAAAGKGGHAPLKRGPGK